MARGKYITEMEKAVIRVGVARGHSDAHIARYIGRSRPMVTIWRTKMQDDGSIHDGMLAFVADDIADDMAGDGK